MFFPNHSKIKRYSINKADNEADISLDLITDKNEEISIIENTNHENLLITSK